ncbi:hypothetical protein KY285_017445 [Solanum tuberosum]|nr:hypothetical protein KY285_017445 [Solanum tuberosum]
MMDDNTHATRNASMQRNRHEFHNFSMNRASARNSTNANFQPTPVAPRHQKLKHSGHLAIHARCLMNT